MNSAQLVFILTTGLLLWQGCHWKLHIRPDLAKLGPGQSVKLNLWLDGGGAGVAQTQAGQGPRFDVLLNLTNPTCGQLMRSKLEQVEAWGPEVTIEFVANRGLKRCITYIEAFLEDQGHRAEAAAKIYVERY